MAVECSLIACTIKGRLWKLSGRCSWRVWCDERLDCRLVGVAQSIDGCDDARQRSKLDESSWVRNGGGAQCNESLGSGDGGGGEEEGRRRAEVGVEINRAVVVVARRGLEVQLMRKQAGRRAGRRGEVGTQWDGSRRGQQAGGMNAAMTGGGTQRQERSLARS